MRTLLRTRRNDEGASLVLALAVVILVGLVTAALLTYAGTGLRSTATTAAVNQQGADTGAALQAALNDVRNSAYFNKAGTSCLPGAKKSYPTSSGSLVVTCAPDPASGGPAGPVEQNANNRLPYALLALATGTEPGITKTKNGPIRIQGNVWSTSTISVENGSACGYSWPPDLTSNCKGIFVDGTVTAEKAVCPAPVWPKTGTFACPAAHVSSADDPGYAQPTPPSTVSTPPTTAACSAATVVPVEPGLYTNATLLNALTSSGNACNNNVFWFKPGVFFFDFKNPGSHVWTFSREDSFLVGGTKKGWTTGKPASVPGACVSPFDDESASGVTFVFGGDSQFEITEGSAELCASYSKTSPPFALFGGKTAGAAPGSFRAQLGCTIVAGGCSTFTAGSNDGPAVQIQGNVYLPRAAITVGLKRAGANILRAGVIVRSAAFTTFPNSSFVGNVIDQPSSATTAKPTDVFFTAWQCPAGFAGTPSAASCTLRGRAQARFTDKDGCFTPCPGKRGVTVRGWKLED